MANTIPCPNPVCTHDFNVAELQSAAQLACPKCGYKIQSKGQAQPKPAVKPAAKPSVKPALAKPTSALATGKVAAATPVQVKSGSSVAAATPVAAAAPVNSDGSISDGTFFNPGVGAAGPLVRTSSPEKKPFNWMRLLIVCFSVGFAVSVLITALALLVMYLPGLKGFRDAFSKSDDSETYVGIIKNSKDEKERVYKLVLPSAEWAYDGEMTNRYSGAPDRSTLVTAWKDTTGYDFWFAVIAKDHGMYKPRDAEMLRVAIDKLEAHFGTDLELDAKPEAAKFGSLPARKLKFRGEFMDAKWEGECYMVFNNGIAYWLFLAAPTRDVVDYFAAQLPEKHFLVASERRGWREQPWPTQTFASSDNKFDVSAPKGVWDQSKDAQVEGANAKLLLAGRYLRVKDNKKNALLIVYTLDKQDDLKTALKSARDQLATREKDRNDSAKVVHADDVSPGQAESGDDKKAGAKDARLIDLKLMIGDEKEPHRYYLLAVVGEPDATYALLGECSWASRDIWRQDFLDVLGTLRLK